MKKPRKRLEASSAMAPGRVFAVAPGASKSILEAVVPAPTRGTRQKGKETHVQSSPRLDDGFQSTDEGSFVCMDLSPVARNQCFDSDAISEEAEELEQHDQGKFIYCCSFTSSFPKCKQCMYACLFGRTIT